MLTIALGFLTLGFVGVRVRREPLARLPRERHHRDRQRRLLAGAVDLARRPDDARAALGDLRDAAGRDEPRHRPRRRRRRLHRDGELPRALPARRAHLRRLRRRPDRLRATSRCTARRAPSAPAATAPSSATRIFMALMVMNALYIGAGIAQLEILPAFAKNEAGVSERGIGWLFFINTLVVVVLQLPTTRLARGKAARAVPRADRRRLRGRLAARAGERPLALGSGRVRAARGRGLDLRGRRVPARRRAARTRRRSRRPAADRALHGDLGALLAGRLHRSARRSAARCSPRRRPGSGS